MITVKQNNAMPFDKWHLMSPGWIELNCILFVCDLLETSMPCHLKTLSNSYDL